MSLLLIFILSVSLSMDAFSLSLAYGTLGINKRDRLFLSFITGVFHFFMPIFGMLLGNLIFNYVKINYDILVFLIFLFIGLEMIISSFKNETIKKMKLSEFFLFAFAVSVDSFSVGITLTKSVSNTLLCIILFSLSSFVFTLFGLSLGNKIERLVGKISTIIGGVVLIGIGVLYIL